MSSAHFAAHRFEEAAHWARRCLRMKSDRAHAHAVLAASCAYLGRVEEARRAIEESIRLQPEVPLAEVSQIYAAADPTFIDLLVEGDRAAGWKE